MTPMQTKELINELIQRGEQNRQDMQAAVQENVQRAIARLGLGDAESLHQELALLRQVVQRMDLRLQALEARMDGKDVHGLHPEL